MKPNDANVGSVNFHQVVVFEVVRVVFEFDLDLDLDPVSHLPPLLQTDE